tara:strand:- start:248 stop:499 length:252 start_codon:yes stop_codon:yes gene_type:complete
MHWQILTSRHNVFRRHITILTLQQGDRMNSMTKEDVTEWALDQMNKYGIRYPDDYLELKHLNDTSDLFISNLLDDNNVKRDNT